MKKSSMLWLWVAGCLGLSALGLWAEEEDAFPLPRWSEEDLRAMREGRPEASPLLNNLLWPENEEALAEALPSPADSPEAKQPTADLSRFLPPHLIASPGAGNFRSLPDAFVATPTSSLREVSADFFAAAQNGSRDQLLIDPDGVLAETMEEDFARFLEFHARDADIRLHVLLLGRDEKLPANANLAAVAQGSLQQGRACLAVVPRGEPWRLRLFLSREVYSVAPPAELAEMLEDSVRDAMQATDEDEQLHRLLVRLSIRLFWLERLLSKQAPAEVVPVSVAPVSVAPVSVAPVRESLPEITLPAPQESPRSPLVLAGCALALVALAFTVLWRWRTYKLRHYVWTLPEGEVPPRLGGAHCGGGTWVDCR